MFDELPANELSASWCPVWGRRRFGTHVFIVSVLLCVLYLASFPYRKNSAFRTYPNGRLGATCLRQMDCRDVGCYKTRSTVLLDHKYPRTRLAPYRAAIMMVGNDHKNSFQYDSNSALLHNQAEKRTSQTGHRYGHAGGLINLWSTVAQVSAPESKSRPALVHWQFINSSPTPSHVPASSNNLRNYIQNKAGFKRPELKGKGNTPTATNTTHTNTSTNLCIKLTNRLSMSHSLLNWRMGQPSFGLHSLALVPYSSYHLFPNEFLISVSSD